MDDLLTYLDDCYSFNRDPAIKMAIDEITRLQKYRQLVMFIANDYTELSHEKAQWQRDDWKKRCVKLQEELEFHIDGDVGC